MNPIPLAAYRRRRSRAAFVRECPTVPPRRVALRAEHAPGEHVLADLAAAWGDAPMSARILARFAAVRALSGGPDTREARQSLDEWKAGLDGTAEGRALARALRTLDPGVRYRALRRAAREAARIGHHAGAHALAGLAFRTARQARRRRAAVAAARSAAEAAGAAGSRPLARRWARRAGRFALAAAS